jgi:hypothetical protein
LQAILGENEAIDDEPNVYIEPESDAEICEPDAVTDVGLFSFPPRDSAKNCNIPVYRPVTLESNGPEAFYESGSSWKLTQQLECVVNAEGPISEAVLFRKVARAWGLERTGSRIVERLKGLLPRSIVRTDEGSSTFYWPQLIDPTGLCPGRIADEASMSKRHVDEVCQEELAALVIHVLEQAGGSPRQDSAKAVCRLIGMARISAESESRVCQAIDRLVKDGRVIEADGNIRSCIVAK